MTLGVTPTGAIKIKTDEAGGGLRAVECACCGGCPAEIEVEIAGAQTCSDDFCGGMLYGNGIYQLTKVSENNFGCLYKIDPEGFDVMEAFYSFFSKTWEVRYFIDSGSGIVGFWYIQQDPQSPKPIICESFYPGCNSEEFGLGPCLYDGTATIDW
jgi:hypothetical protein